MIIDFKYNQMASTYGHCLFVQNNIQFEVPDDLESFILLVDNSFKWFK